MKKIKKVFLMGLSLFLFHLIYIFLWSLYESSFNLSNSLASTFGVGVYMIFYALWAYLLFSFIYVVITRKWIKALHGKIILALALMMISYVLFRTGDIIDGDFIKNFTMPPLLGFVLSAPFMVVVDRFILEIRQL
ncbi:MAG: hypothetical protein RIM99_12790 [Cyclobacteriaceae bacterium]